MQGKLRSAAFFSFMAAASALGLSAQAFKIAIVNAQKAVADTQEIKKAQADLSAKYRPRQQDIEKLQFDLQQMQGQLRGPNVTPQQEQQLSADAQLKQKQLQRLGEDLQQDFNHDRADILNRAGQRMQEI